MRFAAVLHRLPPCLLLWSALVSFGQQSLHGFAPNLIVERNVEMKTRNNVILRADIYRNAAEEVFPVLLQRTPYNKADEEDFARRAALRGYLVVVQDVRGRYASDGEWYPFRSETSDGFDTVEWAAALPHSNGKVGMFGGSYVGATQMLAAIARPPHLAGICPFVTASNYHENWTYQGGAFQQWFSQSWTSELAQDTAARLLLKQTDPLIGGATLPVNAYSLFTPTTHKSLSTATLAPYYLDWLKHPAYDSYWKQWALDEQYPSIQVPALTIAAWYDIFLDGSLCNFIGLKAGAGAEKARRQQRLLITIGGHAGSGRKIGALDFGPNAAFDEGEVVLSWYDYLLKGTQNQFATDFDVDHPVRLFVLGENKWRSETSWPLQQAVSTPYYLHSGGKANSRSGDGSLSLTVSTTEPSDRYLYDPLKPVPTTGGPLCCDPKRIAPGPQDQQQLETRADVLIYSTPPLDQDLEVIGPITLDLYASSSAPDTDFVAKLIDVWPDGFAQNLTEGILRARYRDSTTHAEPITPGKIYTYQINMAATANRFLKGHILRLEVSSSNYPRFDRNLNTGANNTATSLIRKATNTVFHDKTHHSTLHLPVISR